MKSSQEVGSTCPIGPISTSASSRENPRHSSGQGGRRRLTQRQRQDHVRLVTSRRDREALWRLLRQPNGHVAKWHARSHYGVTKRGAEPDGGLSR